MADKRESNGVGDRRTNFFDDLIDSGDAKRLKELNAEATGELAEKCMAAYDRSKNGYLDATEFKAMLRDLFWRDGRAYAMPPRGAGDIFAYFDANDDGKIDRRELQLFWRRVVAPVLCPVSALIVVDVQNDFIDGSLALKNCPAKQDGKAVVSVINNLIKTVNFECIAYTWDWHPENHCSFVDNVHLYPLHSSSPITAENAKVFDMVIFKGPPIMEQTLWPRHCVQGTKGAELHKSLNHSPMAFDVLKGTNPDIDSYSAFYDNGKLAETELREKLVEHGVTDVFVAGLAYDVCVAATAEHALECGFRTVVVDDACRGVDLASIESTKRNLISKGAAIARSTEVAAMVAGTNRKPELGFYLVNKWKTQNSDTNCDGKLGKACNAGCFPPYCTSK